MPRSRKKRMHYLLALVAAKIETQAIVTMERRKRRRTKRNPPSIRNRRK
jgi:hypothetical protein